MHIKIVIEGETKSGRSRTTYAIQQMLENKGARVTVHDQDVDQLKRPGDFPAGMVVDIHTKLVPKADKES